MVTDNTTCTGLNIKPQGLLLMHVYFFSSEQVPSLDTDFAQSESSTSSPLCSYNESKLAISQYTTVPSQPTQTDYSDINAFLGPDTQPFNPKLKTYKLVGDNIDKNVQTREMRADNQTKSLHYFHTYGVRDRIDLSMFSNETKIPDVGSIRLDTFLPSHIDERTI